jgi:hypothetical protein
VKFIDGEPEGRKVEFGKAGRRSAWFTTFEELRDNVGAWALVIENGTPTEASKARAGIRLLAKRVEGLEVEYSLREGRDREHRNLYVRVAVDPEATEE